MLAEDRGILTIEFSLTVLNDGAWLALSGFGCKPEQLQEAGTPAPM